MTTPIKEDDFPKWVSSTSKLAKFLVPGLLAAYWLLMNPSIKQSLTSQHTNPPTLVYEILNMSVAILLVVSIILCGPTALDLLRTFITKK